MVLDSVFHEDIFSHGLSRYIISKLSIVERTSFRKLESLLFVNSVCVYVCVDDSRGLFGLLSTLGIPEPPVLFNRGICFALRHDS